MPLISSLFNTINDTIFPPRCLGCGTIGNWICQNCTNRHLTTTLPECGVCRRLSSGFDTHEGCRTPSFPISKLLIKWRYSELPKRIMRTFKYHFRYRILQTIVDPCLDLVRRHIPPDTLLVPVPSATSSVRHRGFNQSQLIAKYIAARLGYETIQPLKRTQTSTHQAGLAREERLKLKESSFYLDSYYRLKLAHRKLAIIDDVCTTGKTLTACARILKQTNPRKIYAFCLFRGSRRGNYKRKTNAHHLPQRLPTAPSTSLP